MTAQTGRVQPKVGELLAFNRLVCNELGLMAILALLLCMCPLQVIPGETMVESSCIEPEDLEGESMMIVVAYNAAFSADRGGGVVPFVLIDAGLQFGMACKAFGIGHLVAQLVAFGAVGQPLQMGMYRSQRSGRDLCDGLRTAEGDQEENKY